MKIKIENNDKEIEIELTTLQIKAIQLTGQKPEDYLAHKLERILEFAVNQAKQKIDRISPLTDEEVESMIDEIKEESQDVSEES